ncbi:hypothetical protein RQP46_009172 [Phenoliferia psychrophenolica]
MDAAPETKNEQREPEAAAAAAAAAEELKPDFAAGVSYWANTPATVNGVLGGYGPTTAVPRLDAAMSRMLLLSILPQLSTIVPPHRHTKNASPPSPRRSFRALDCGAGIGRVTSTVLLPLFDRVDLVEPVQKFLDTARDDATKAHKEGWKLVKDGAHNKGVRMWLAGLQHFDPAKPATPLGGGSSVTVGTFGDATLTWPPPTESTPQEDGYDVVMIQWCIGHLSDAELVGFLQRSQKALRRSEFGLEGYIVLKENVCRDDACDGTGSLWDDDDSSITRSDKVFRKVFEDAGLTLIRREVQKGFPQELFPVIAYVLR